MKLILVAFFVLVAAVVPSAGATLSKTYSYFSIGGTTMDQIEAELNSRGPRVKSTGRRHPGATRMEFTTKLSYVEKKGYCRVADARVSVKAKVILPRWRPRGGADADVRMIWDTLSRDIRRHEESHIVIAKNHAREIEQVLKKLDRQKSCHAAAEKAKLAADKILAKHDRAQEHFDRVEGINFENRLLRLLRYRLERDEASR